MEFFNKTFVSLVIVGLLLAFSSTNLLAQVGSWTTGMVTTSGTTNNFVSVTTDSSGNFYGAWRPAGGTNGFIEIGSWDGNAWSVTSSFSPADSSLFASISDDVSLAIDSMGDYHVAFRAEVTTGSSNTERGVFYAKYDIGAGTWSFEKVQTAQHPNGFRNYNDPVIDVDSFDNPHMTFQFSDASDNTNPPRPEIIRYAEKNGSWTFTDVDSTSDGFNIFIDDFVLDSSDNAHISYRKETVDKFDSDVWYATNSSGSFVTTKVVGADSNTDPSSGVRNSSIDIDSNDMVHISYSFGTFSSTNLRHVTNAPSGTFGSPTNITSGAFTNDIGVSSSNNKVIVYNNGFSDLNIYAATQIGTDSWNTETVWSNAGDDFGTGSFLDGAINDNDDIMILFHRNTDPDGNVRVVMYATGNLSAAATPPDADAGSDKVINEGQSVQIGGSPTGSGGNGGPYTYSWSPTTGLSNSTIANPTASPAITTTYTVTVTETSTTLTSTDSVTVTVNNVAPTANAGADQTVNEGDTVNFSGSFTDPGTSDTHTFSWNFGDSNTTSGTLTPTHVYTDNGTFTVTLTVTDNDGGVGTDTLTVTVNNVAPTANAGSNQTVNEGDTVSFSGSFTDPGSSDIQTISWDFGDSTSDNSGTLTPTHVYTDNGTFTVTLTVTDDDGGVGTDTLTVTVNNVAPTANAGSDQTVNEGDTVNFSGSFTDPGSSDTQTISWDFGDSTSDNSGTLTPTHVYTDNGTFTVTLIVTDDDGGVGTDTMTVTVNNVAPTITSVNLDSTSINENDSVALSGSFTDPSSVDTHDVTISWGDNSTDTTLSLTSGEKSFSNVTHQYLDDNPTGTVSDNYTVTVTITDDDGGSGNATTTITVQDVPPQPIIDMITDENGAVIGVNSPVALVGLQLTLSGSFTDQGQQDTHTASTDWGDGTTTVSNVTQGSGNGTVVDTHTYTIPSDVTVTLTVTDDDTLSGNVAQDIKVVDAGGASEAAIEMVDLLLTTLDLNIKTEKLLKDILTQLEGTNDGLADNGAVDYFEQGNIIAGLGKIKQALQAIKIALIEEPSLNVLNHPSLPQPLFDFEVVDIQNLLVLTAKSVYVDALAQAQANATTDKQLLKIDRAETFAANAEDKFSNGDYVGAAGDYLTAVKAIQSLL
jgi:PKD repeat protein